MRFTQKQNLKSLRKYGGDPNLRYKALYQPRVLTLDMSQDNEPIGDGWVVNVVSCSVVGDYGISVYVFPVKTSVIPVEVLARVKNILDTMYYLKLVVDPPRVVKICLESYLLEEFILELGKTKDVTECVDYIITHIQPQIE